MTPGRPDGATHAALWYGLAKLQRPVRPNNPFPAAPLQCLFCGNPERVEVFEVWGHEFILDTCCEGMHEQIVAGMNDDPAWGRRLLQRLGIEERCGHALRRIADDECCGMVLDWQLRIAPVTQSQARDFIARHHGHCNPPVAWRFQTGIYNGSRLLGAVVVGNPVARSFNGRDIIDINRLCIRRDTARALRWNAASMLYGWCAREAARQVWMKIITYTRAEEPVTSLWATGWHQKSQIHGRGWHSQRRSRSNINSWMDKIRWSKMLKRRQAQSGKAKLDTPMLWRGARRLDDLITYGDGSFSPAVEGSQSISDASRPTRIGENHDQVPDPHIDIVADQRASRPQRDSVTISMR